MRYQNGCLMVVFVFVVAIIVIAIARAIFGVAVGSCFPAVSRLKVTTYHIYKHTCTYMHMYIHTYTDTLKYECCCAHVIYYMHIFPSFNIIANVLLYYCVLLYYFLFVSNICSPAICLSYHSILPTLLLIHSFTHTWAYVNIYVCVWIALCRQWSKRFVGIVRISTF